MKKNDLPFIIRYLKTINRIQFEIFQNVIKIFVTCLNILLWFGSLLQTFQHVFAKLFSLNQLQIFVECRKSCWSNVTKIREAWLHLFAGQYFMEEYTGTWSGTDTRANCNKVEHDKILKYIGKLSQERKSFANLPMSMEVTCLLAPAMLLGGKYDR